MLPEFNGFSELLRFSSALLTVTGAMSWFRRGSPQEDKVVSEACDTLIEGVSDADNTNKIDLHTGRNIRDQISIEQAEDMNRERELRRFPNRN